MRAIWSLPTPYSVKKDPFIVPFSGFGGEEGVSAGQVGWNRLAAPRGTGQGAVQCLLFEETEEEPFRQTQLGSMGSRSAY